MSAKVIHKRMQDRGTIGRGLQQQSISNIKQDKKQLQFVWSLAYNLSDLSGHSIIVLDGIACKIF